VERELLEQCGQALLWWSVSWLQRCDECIEQLEELCRAKHPRFTVGYRQSAVARIARLAESQVERRFVHIDGEYASGNERFPVWREIDATFESTLTNVVINSNHIESRRFLEDAGNVALERDAVERHGNIRVNTTFNSEYEG